MAVGYETVVQQLQGLGWSREQALGLAANFQAESNFNHQAVGDSGKAYGIGQWHPDRQAQFKVWKGKDIRESTLEEQVAFADYELRQGAERSAGRRLLAAQTAGDAASIVSQFYERPADRHGEARKRGSLAARWAGEVQSRADDAVAPRAYIEQVQEGPYSGAGEANDWPVVPRAGRAEKTPPAAPNSAELDHLAASRTSLLRTDHNQAASAARADAQVAATERVEGTGFSEAWEASRVDRRDNTTFQILDALGQGSKPQEEPVPGYYETVQDKIEAGLPHEYRMFLRENVVGPESEAWAMAEVQSRADADATYADAGGFTAFLARAGVTMMDPSEYALTLGLGKAIHLGALGIAGVRTGRTVGGTATLGEGILGNVAVETLQDALGEVKGIEDYTMASVMGAAISAPFAVTAAGRAARQATMDRALEIRDQAVRQQAQALEEFMQRTGETDPVKAARGYEAEQAKAIGEFADAQAPGQKIREQVVPEDVNAELRAEYQTGDSPVEAPPPVPASPDSPGAPAAPLDLHADTDPSLRQPSVLSGPEAFPTIDVDSVDAQIKGHKEIPNSDPSKPPITLNWVVDKQPNAPGVKAGDVVDFIASGKAATTPATRNLALYMQSILSAAVRDVTVTFGDRVRRGEFNPNTERIATPGKDSSLKQDIRYQLSEFSPWHHETVLHEILHAASHARIETYRRALRDGTPMSPELRAAGDAFTKEFHHFLDVLGIEGGFSKQKLTKGGGKPADMDDLEYSLKYAAQNEHEFLSMFMSDRAVQAWAAKQRGSGASYSNTSNLWRSFVGAMQRLFGAKPDSMLETATAAMDRLLRADLSDVRYMGGGPALAGPASGGVRVAARKRWASRLYQHAEQFVARNPIDTERLKVLTAKVGGMSDGLVLAASNNPIMKMVAALVTETTTGAAGRKASVAIRTTMLDQRFVGNALLEFDAAFTRWNRANGGTTWDTVVTGNKRREFDRAVYLETISRRQAGYQPRADEAVRAAADSLEQVFERARVAQVEAGTLGSANLPQSSRGYMPQALDGTVLQTLNIQELDALHATLSRQLQQRLGWDASFADTFAPYYTDRVRKRVQGSKGVDALSGGGDAMTTVRDTLEDMAIDPQMRDKMTAATNARAGLGQTKRRLDFDLTEEFVPGRMLLDLYSTDALNLARMYSRRTAGHTALTESGILGIRGVRELREAAGTLVRDGTQPTKAEFDAFDRVFSEILGTPVSGQVVSAGATNLRLLVGLQRLGGLAFTQAAEQWNMLHHLGLRATMSANLSVLTRARAEVGRLKKGEAPGNNILTSIETYGGEFGADIYKMVMPLDPPDRQLEQYMQQSGLVSRLLRAGGHFQSKVSFFRGVMASQHRATAEQIVMKAARYIRDGGSDAALRDMGFTDELVQALKADLPRVAQWDARGKLVAWDLTQVRDPATAEAFAQSVHRGVSQIIQGTFIGERNKWLHNDYLKLLLQLRTFGLTATEKQLGRTVMNQGGGAKGYAYAGGLLLGQMAMALPLHLARIQLAAAGREDREKFVKEATAPAALVLSLMNYSSISGSAGDILDLTTALAGGWLGDEGREMIGARTGQATSIGRLVPAFGSIDAAFKVLGGQSSLYNAIKQLPFSNLPYLQPWVGMTKE